MSEMYSEKAYELAKKNTKYNEAGRAVISNDDEWCNETEWEKLYDDIKMHADFID